MKSNKHNICTTILIGNEQARANNKHKHSKKHLTHREIRAKALMHKINQENKRTSTSTATKVSREENCSEKKGVDYNWTVVKQIPDSMASMMAASNRS